MLRRSSHGLGDGASHAPAHGSPTSQSTRGVDEKAQDRVARLQADQAIRDLAARYPCRTRPRPDPADEASEPTATGTDRSYGSCRPHIACPAPPAPVSRTPRAARPPPRHPPAEVRGRCIVTGPETASRVALRRSGSPCRTSEPPRGYSMSSTASDGVNAGCAQETRGQVVRGHRTPAAAAPNRLLRVPVQRRCLQRPLCTGGVWHLGWARPDERRSWTSGLFGPVTGIAAAALPSEARDDRTVVPRATDVVQRHHDQGVMTGAPLC